MTSERKERLLSLRHIARSAGISRHVVSALVVHYKIPVQKTRTMTAILPHGVDKLVKVLEKHPGVSPGVRDRILG